MTIQMIGLKLLKLSLAKSMGVSRSLGCIKLSSQTFSSPSFAALAGIQDAGSERKTVNRWTSWKTEKGKTLYDLREIFLNNRG